MLRATCLASGCTALVAIAIAAPAAGQPPAPGAPGAKPTWAPGSYTHLTLPTILRV
jgi:hypothetical protein